MADARADRSFLPYGRQQIDEDDIAAVAKALKGDWLTTGPEVAGFEADFCAATDAAHTVVCASGTAALHLAATALDLGPGDAAIVPTITFAATANVMRLTGAEVVFADVDADSGLMTIENAEAAFSRVPTGLTVRAVFPVHMAGQVADPPAIADFAAAHDLTVISDACHALGASYRDGGNAWHPVGANADDEMSCFSFHPVKAIAAGEGGAVTTRNTALAEKLRQYRHHGIVRGDAMRDADVGEPWQYEVQDAGFNYRASDIHCALARSQLKKLSAFVARRATLVAHYDRLLAPLADKVRPLARNGDCQPAWHLYVALFDWAAIGKSRAGFMAALKERGIGSQVHYIPVHGQPYYRDRYGEQHLPGADTYYRRCLSLPLYAAMTEHDVARVVEAIAELTDA